MNCGRKSEYVIVYRSYIRNLLLRKESLKKIQAWAGSFETMTDLCDTSAVLYQLSYQANWELVILWIHDIPVEVMRWKWIYENPFI